MITCVPSGGVEEGSARPLNLVELFSGSHRLTDYATEQGLAVASMDVLGLDLLASRPSRKVSYSRHMDLLSDFGFLLAFSYLRRLRRGGHASQLSAFLFARHWRGDFASRVFLVLEGGFT